MIRCGTTPQVTGCTNNVDNSLGNGVSIYSCSSGANFYVSVNLSALIKDLKTLDRCYMVGLTADLA